MRVALAQINTTVGDFAGNADKILKKIQQAQEEHCDLIVFPESTLFGYHPFDLLERSDLVDEQMKELKRIHAKIPKGLAALVGVITKNKNIKGRPYFNSVALLEKGKKPKFFHKQLLPTGDVFDEARFIESGSLNNNFFSVKGKRVFLTICEDIWGWSKKSERSPYKTNPITEVPRKKVDLVVNMSASPYYPRKFKKRRELVALTAGHFKAPMVYVNMVGAQDEIIFDGTSFGCDPKGKLLYKATSFEEELAILDFEKKVKPRVAPELEITEEICKAVILGIRDYCEKAGIKNIHLGLSGGIDSAVLACLAVDALGSRAVKVLALPGPFNAEKSLTLAKELAKNLNVELLVCPIEGAYQNIKGQLEPLFGIHQFGLVHENMQARLRGLYLMAYSNHTQSLLISTANKSEYAAGYSTLYGDMCGGLAPLGDLTKKQVYAIARHYNREWEVIPQEIIDRAPSAELRPNQKDQDSLPAYDLLDESVERVVERAEKAKTETDRWLLKTLLKSEFKRWQAPPILKVSAHSFGRGRRWPLAVRLKS